MRHGRLVVLALVVLFAVLTGFWLVEGHPLRAAVAAVNAAVALFVARRSRDAPQAV